MRLTKFGKALAMGALSAGIICGVTSCDQSYSVGYLYVTGTVTASSGNNGIISGFRSTTIPASSPRSTACRSLRAAPTRSAPSSLWAAGLFIF